jgi:NitT/TauT family transport system substrate-binding protein
MALSALGMGTLSRSRMLAATAAALAAAPHAVRAQTPPAVRLIGVPTDDMTPVFSAVKNGLYQKAGLDLTLVPTSSGAVAVDAIMAGTYEIGKGSAISILNAYLHGLPIRIIGNGPIWDEKTPFSMMIVASDAPAKDGSYFNGKTLCTAALRDLNQLAMCAWIDQHGGDSKTITWVEAPNSAAGVAVGDHRFAATMLQEPQLSAAVATGSVRAFAPAYNGIAPHFSTALYFVQSDWAAKNGKTIKTFLDATYAAARATNGHQADTAAMMSEVTKIPLPVYQKMARANWSLKSDPALVQPMIDVAAKYGYISKAFSAKEIFI